MGERLFHTLKMQDAVVRGARRDAAHIAYPGGVAAFAALVDSKILLFLF
ncbi:MULTISPECIES: hypothetical protein [Burkholderia cepacia complex]|nr:MULTISPECIES: hypothetical protein [Burkholderia cepacia complex]